MKAEYSQIALNPLRLGTFVFSFTLVLLTVTPFRAQSVRHMTLQQVIDSAMTRDLRLASLGVQMEAGIATRKQIPLQGLPQLRYNAGASYAPVSPYFGYDPTVSNGGQLNAQIVATESLYDGGKRNIEQKQSELDYEHLDRQRDIEKADLKLQITQAFVDILHARESAHLMDSSLRELTSYHELSQRLFAGGVVGETDVLSVESQLQSAQIARERARADEVTARFVLSELLGTPQDTSVILDGKLSELAVGSEQSPSDLDSTSNLELRIKQIELQKAELAIDLARANKNPTLELLGDAGLLSSIQNIQQRPGDRASILGASIGIVLDGPLLDWGANNLLVDQRSLEATNTKIETMQLARSLSAQYIRTRAQLTAALDRLQPLREALALSSKNYSLILSKYAGGAAKAIEVLDAHRQIIDARAGILDAEAEIIVLRATLERLNTKS